MLTCEAFCLEILIQFFMLIFNRDISRADVISKLKTWQCTTALLGRMPILFSTITFNKLISGIAVLKASLMPINSASVLSNISVYTFEAQISAQPAYLTIYPVFDFAVDLSMVSAFKFQ